MNDKPEEEHEETSKDKIEEGSEKIPTQASEYATELQAATIPNAVEEEPENAKYDIPDDINEGNLLEKIWLQPKDTIHYIFEHCPDKYVTILLVLGGVVRAIDRASMKNMGDNMSTAAVLAITIGSGALLGWITYYIYAWAMSVTGEWMKGHARPTKFRTVIAWSLVPSIAALVLLIPEVIIFGDDLFRSVPHDDSTFNGIMWVVFGVLEMTVAIWTLVILVKGIAIIQGFGIGKAILNMLLPALVLLGIIAAIAMIAFIIGDLFN